MQRNKGKKFEREVAALLRSKFATSTVRRASQAERAYQSDVFIDGPGILPKLWLELQDAREPDPELKLEQAERDVTNLKPKCARLPAVIWHKYREKRCWATCRVSVLAELMGLKVPKGAGQLADIVVTMDLEDFFDVLVGAVPGSTGAVTAEVPSDAG